jgi:hypothetical protein
MRTIIVLASSAIAAATLAAGFATADDHLHVSPPITREHAHAIQASHPAQELAVVPQPVRAGAKPLRVTSAATRLELADR